jgi:hypothetical protein
MSAQCDGLLYAQILAMTEIFKFRTEVTLLMRAMVICDRSSRRLQEAYTLQMAIQLISEFFR